VNGSGVRAVTLVPGDGIGPSVVGAARRVIEATGTTVRWDVHPIGAPALRAGAGSHLPEALLASVRRTGVALKGPVTTSISGAHPSVNTGLRMALDLFCQVRRCRSYPGVGDARTGVDLAIVRQTTEDLYAGLELAPGSEDARRVAAILAGRSPALPPEAGMSIKFASPDAVARVAHFALDWSRRTGRHRITVAHKATVMRQTDGLFLSVVREIASRQSDVEVDDMLVDNLAAQLVRRPDRFDVVLTSNMYGDILSDLAAGLTGGVGLVPGGNFGHGLAVFEPGHGSAPALAGTGRADPMAAILCGAMLLRHLGLFDAAHRVEAAVRAVLVGGRHVTYDVAPAGAPVAGTDEAADAVIAAMA